MGVPIRQHDREQTRLAHETHGLECPELGAAELEPVEADDHGLLRPFEGGAGRHDHLVLVRTPTAELRLIVARLDRGRELASESEQREIARIVIEERSARLDTPCDPADEARALRAVRIGVENAVGRHMQMPGGRRHESG